MTSPAKFRAWLRRYAIACHMQDRCEERKRASLDIHDPAEATRLYRHWTARADYWRRRGAAIATEERGNV